MNGSKSKKLHRGPEHVVCSFSRTVSAKRLRVAAAMMSWLLYKDPLIPSAIAFEVESVSVPSTPSPDRVGPKVGRLSLVRTRHAVDTSELHQACTVTII